MTNLRVQLSFSASLLSHMLQVLGVYHEAPQLNAHRNSERKR